MAAALLKIPLPTQNSIQFRHNLAQLVSPLRRIKPRVPFFKLAAHRIPTLWHLYRHILRESPTENIRWRVQKIFKREQHRTSATRAQEQLAQGYKWLEAFRKANHDKDEYWRKVLNRFDAIIAIKREKSFWRRLAKNEKKWQEKLANRPIVKPSILRASIVNKPMPRLSPQPLKIHYMIKGRVNQRQKRTDRLAAMGDMREDLQLEAEMETGLAKYSGQQGRLTPFYSDSQSYREWLAPIRQTIKDIQKTFDNDTAREQSPYTPELLATIAAAKKEKTQNKTREKHRERQGEILNSTIKRARKGPPAHILSRMSEQDKYNDSLARRSILQVGPVGEIKRQMGFKITVPPELFMTEVGGVDPERREALNKEYYHLVDVMARRRQQVEKNMRAMEKKAAMLEKAKKDGMARNKKTQNLPEQ